MLVQIAEPQWQDDDEGNSVWHSPIGTFRIDKQTAACFKDHQFRYCRGYESGGVSAMQRVIFEQFLYEIEAKPVLKTEAED